MDFQTTNTIEITDTNGNDEASRISSRLNALVLSREGTLPGNRNFGLAGTYLSKPPLQATNIFAIEVSEKAAVYIPEIDIKEVSGAITGDGMDGITIHIERSGKA